MALTTGFETFVLGDDVGTPLGTYAPSLPGSNHSPMVESSPFACHSSSQEAEDPFAMPSSSPDLQQQQTFDGKARSPPVLSAEGLTDKQALVTALINQVGTGVTKCDLARRCLTCQWSSSSLTVASFEA